MPQKRRRPTNSLSYLEDDDTEQVLTLDDHTIEELEADDGDDRNDILLSLKNKETEVNEKDGDETEVVGGESLDAGPARQISDFYTQEEAASLFRKPKKSKKSSAADKKRKKNGKKTSVNDLIDNERVNALMTRQTQIDDSNFADDDDDLQRAIARVRKASSVLKSSSLSEEQEEDIMSQVARPSNVESAAIEDESSSGDLVLSSTIEFVQNIRASVRNIKQSLVADSRRHRSAKEEPPSSDAELPEADSKTIEHSEKSNEHGLELADQTNAEVAEFEAEPSVGSGLAATLSLLRQRNMLDNLSKEQKDRERLQRNRTTWLAEQRKKEMLLQQERQRIKRLGRDLNSAPDTTASSAGGRSGSKRRGKADPMSQQEIEELKAREQELLDRKWAREYEEQMKDYKPDVKLEYHDETGRKLTTKEAYKQLSHAFHGHYSGKNKIDRVMKKREKERKQMEMATSSTAHERGAALENIHRKHGTAGIVMSERDDGDLNHKNGQY